MLLVDAQGAGAQTTSTIDQTLLDPADSVVAIGESVEYRIRIELSEGTAPLTLTNVMPTLASSDGVVSFQSGSVVSVGPGISTALTVGPAPSATDQIGVDGFADTVVFDFGTVTVEAPSAEANVIVVEVVGRVDQYRDVGLRRRDTVRHRNRFDRRTKADAGQGIRSTGGRSRCDDPVHGDAWSHVRFGCPKPSRAIRC